ncbi:MAG: HAD-IIB family hydrolase [Verrucomicrobiota bacterium]|nr:HAD-IIB family hydrolase [Verrucomicrobiota bacterium]
MYGLAHKINGFNNLRMATEMPDCLKQSRIRALVFDLDDTLLNTKKAIGIKTLDALFSWIDSGGSIVLATSRPIRAVRHFINNHLLESCEVISLNGAIHHSHGRVVYKASKIGEIARKIVDEFPVQRTIRFSLEMEGESFATNVSYSDEVLWIEQSATRDMLLPLDSINYNEVSKLAINGLGTRIDDLADWMQSLGAGVIPCNEGTFLNVVDQSVDKSTTLARHATIHGWGRDSFAVFGDDIPDVKMMSLCDHAVAMGNARDAVKNVAQVTIGHCDEDIIGDYVRKLMEVMPR